MESFAARLKHPLKSDAISQFLATQLAISTRDLLGKYNGGSAWGLQCSLVQDLNYTLDNVLLYNPHLFVGIRLSSEATSFLKQEQRGGVYRPFGWLLLLNAYPRELARHGFNSGESFRVHRRSGKKEAHACQSQCGHCQKYSGQVQDTFGQKQKPLANVCGENWLILLLCTGKAAIPSVHVLPYRSGMIRKRMAEPWATREIRCSPEEQFTNSIRDLVERSFPVNASFAGHVSNTVLECGVREICCDNMEFVEAYYAD